MPSVLLLPRAPFLHTPCPACRGNGSTDASLLLCLKILLHSLGISLMWPESISAPGRRPLGVPQCSATFLSRPPQPPSHQGSDGFVPTLSALRTGKLRSGFNGRTTRASTQLENGCPLKKKNKTQENRKKLQPTNYKKTKNQKQVKKKEYHRYRNPFFYFLDHL